MSLTDGQKAADILENSSNITTETLNFDDSVNNATMTSAQIDQYASLDTGNVSHDEASKAKTKKAMTTFTADMDRIWESIPDRRKKMIEKEIKLRKITIMLDNEGFTKEEINQVFSRYPSEELFNDIVQRFDESDLPDPDISDIL